MKQKQSFLKRWMMKNFVIYSEVLGYVIALSIIGFAIYSMFVYEEVLLPVNGTLETVHEKIDIDDESCILKFYVEPGTFVNPGDKVCQVVTGEENMELAAGLRGLNLVENRFKGAGVDEATMTTISQLRDGIALPDTTTDIIAPISGQFFANLQENDLKTIPADGYIGGIYNLDTLTMEGTIPLKEQDKVTTDMLARVEMSGAEATIDLLIDSIDVLEQDVAVIFQAIKPADYDKLKLGRMVSYTMPGSDVTKECKVISISEENGEQAFTLKGVVSKDDQENFSVGNNLGGTYIETETLNGEIVQLNLQESNIAVKFIFKDVPPVVQEQFAEGLENADTSKYAPNTTVTIVKGTKSLFKKLFSKG